MQQTESDLPHRRDWNDASSCWGRSVAGNISGHDWPLELVFLWSQSCERCLANLPFRVSQALLGIVCALPPSKQLLNTRNQCKLSHRSWTEKNRNCFTFLAFLSSDNQAIREIAIRGLLGGFINRNKRRRWRRGRGRWSSGRTGEAVGAVTLLHGGSRHLKLHTEESQSTSHHPSRADWIPRVKLTLHTFTAFPFHPQATTDLFPEAQRHLQDWLEG